MQKYDYIITGMGASGLMLVYHLISDPFFDQKTILLIDKQNKNRNDRTWCFWEKENGTWDEIIHKKWNYIFFGSTNFSEKIKIDPYQYKMIQSKDFYQYVLKAIAHNTNITIIKENVQAIKDEGDIVEVQTDQRIHLGNKVFNSVIFSSEYKEQKRFPLLNQHFLGWFIKTSTPSFEAETATFMDFTVPQKGNTRFMYVLPLSETEALVEYTLFSEKLLEENEYELEIKEYLKQKGINDYNILEKEKGCIPMTCYDFRKYNSKNVINIGTAGGWTKPSTGYTFSITLKNIKKLTEYLKHKSDLSKFGKRTKFWYYDLLFIDILYKENEKGSALFSQLFKKNDSKKILKFLDEETSFIEDVKITTSLPNMPFLKALWKRIF